MAWMDGSESEGVACCVKHFPGHGDTHVDSHRDLPTVDKELAELERFEFAPFRARRAACAGRDDRPHRLPGARSAPPGHDVARDPDRPAARKMGYEGVIITDGMDMHAIAHRYGAGEAAVNALVAGADMVMAIGSRETQEATLDAIAAAIADGTLPMAEVQARLDRLDKLAQAHPAGSARTPPTLKTAP
jgi:beta-N-acetylhexosaminidase